MKHSWETWQHWAQTSDAPGQWLHELRDTGELEAYPEIFNMIGVQQDPTWHPEGDVYVHTCHVLDAAANIAIREKLEVAARELLIFSALTHDFGKVKATFLKNGKWTSPKHGMYSVDCAKKFFERIQCPLFDEKIPKLAIEHLSYVNVETDKSLLKLAERLKPASMKELLWLIEADVSGRPPLPKGLPEQGKKIKSRSIELGVYHRGPECLPPEQPFKPILNGHIIINSGILPAGNQVGKLLAEAKLAQRQGLFTDLDGALAWARKWAI
jgi:tRNA nucleotidyltransferase (CCA-adding enzyme)